MSLFLKNQWQQWARQWGATHVPEKGWMHRTERVLGMRNGLLFRVHWGPDEDPGLHVLIRFPSVENVERLRDSLVGDSTLDALPAKGAPRRKMQMDSGKTQMVRWNARPEFLLGPTSLVWRRKYAFKAPKPAQIQAWVDALIESIVRSTPGFRGQCETCPAGQVQKFVVVDEQPMMMCTTCQQRLKIEGEMAERAYEMTEAQHLNGALLASGAAIVGGIVWAGVGALTHRVFAMAAIGIGALVAWAYRRGAGRVDAVGRVIGAVLTVSSVALGEVLYYSIWVAQQRPDIGFRLDTGWYAYMFTWAKSPGEEAMPMIFSLVGAWVAMKALEKPKLAAKLEEPSEPEMRKAA